MQKWKLDIFVDAIKIRYSKNEGSYEELVDTYTKLTSYEKSEILKELNLE